MKFIEAFKTVKRMCEDDIGDCIYEDTYTCCKKCWDRPLEE